MMKARIASGLLVLVLAGALVGCSSSNKRTVEGRDKPSGGEAGVPTLTKATLPTAVGTKWDIIRTNEDATPLDFKVDGPWTLTSGEGWHTESHEIIDPAATPSIDKFDDYTLVMKVTEADWPTYYYPRQITDDWVLSVGIVKDEDGAITAEPNEPAKYWPLQLEVGQDYTVMDSKTHQTVATVLSRNTATVPAGTVENTYLVRFRTAAKSGEGEPRDEYYLLAPNVGMVAFVSGLAGDEESGFTAADCIELLSSMP